MIRALEEKEHDCFIQISFFSEIQRVALSRRIILPFISHFVLLGEKTRVTNFQRIKIVLFLVKLKTLILNKWKFTCDYRCVG